MPRKIKNLKSPSNSPKNKSDSHEDNRGEFPVSPTSSKPLSRELVYLPVGNLTPYKANSRTHGKDQIEQIVASMKEFGFTNPLLINEDNGIIAGHGRLEAAKLLGLADVPCIRLEGLTEEQQRALVIADNKLALNAGWDEEILAQELTWLDDVGFDLELTGFSEEELSNILDLEVTEVEGDEDEEFEPPKEPTTVLGDLYEIGQHRLMCGDSTSIDAVDALMAGEKADMVFTDPPYGISINFDAQYSKTSSNRVAKRQDYGKIQNDETTDVAEEVIDLCLGLYPDAIHVYWGANYYSNLPPSKCWISWYKKEGLPEDSFCDTELAWTNADKHCKTMSVNWRGMIKEGETGQKRVHPTQKPLLLAEQCFEYLNAKGNILDLFGGSGSTMVASHKTNRKCFMMELDPKYCDVIVTRMHKLFPDLPIKLNGEEIEWDNE